ncbi:hypothetical protein BH09MYX1_BH09MYX1_54870 [soil metagenome]
MSTTVARAINEIKAIRLDLARFAGLDDPAATATVTWIDGLIAEWTSFSVYPYRNLPISPDDEDILDGLKRDRDALIAQFETNAQRAHQDKAVAEMVVAYVGGVDEAISLLARLTGPRLLTLVDDGPVAPGNLVRAPMQDVETGPVDVSDFQEWPMSIPGHGPLAIRIPGPPGGAPKRPPAQPGPGPGQGPLAITWDVDAGRPFADGSSSADVANAVVAMRTGGGHGDEISFGGPGGSSVLAKLRHGGGGHSGMFGLSENNEGLFTHKQRGPRDVNAVAVGGGGSGSNTGGKTKAPGPNPAPGRGTSDTKSWASDGRVTSSEGRGIRAETNTPSTPTASHEVSVGGGTTTVSASPTPAPNPPEDANAGGSGGGTTGGSVGDSTAGSGSGSSASSTGSKARGSGGGGDNRDKPSAQKTPEAENKNKTKDRNADKTKDPDDEHKKKGGASNPNPEDDGTGGGGGPRASGGQNESPNPEDSGGGGNPRARGSRSFAAQGALGGTAGPRGYNFYTDPDSSGGGNPRTRYERPNPEDTNSPHGPTARGGYTVGTWSASRNRML